MTDATEARIRGFAAGDLRAGERLVAQAGWNQTADDWRIFLARGEAFAIDGPDGVIATAATLPYGGLAWISMVLVDEAHRRRGLARALLARCVAAIRAAGRTPMLDATPAGRAVYAGLGFRDLFGLQRWTRGPAATGSGGARSAVRRLSAADLPAVAALDERAFGAARPWLIEALAGRSGGFAGVHERGGVIDGFVLGRPGRVATQIGPLVAAREDAGGALLRHAAALLPGPLCVDALDGQRVLADALQALGFKRQRPFTRMAWDTDAAPGDPGRYLAAAGPELG